MAKKPTPATPDQVAAAVAALRAFWKTGRASSARVGGSATGGAARPRTATRKGPAYVHGNKITVLKAEAAKEGTNVDTLAKSWRAAREYTSEQIEQLCGLVERHKARFGPTHLTRLLAVVDRKRRDELAREAIRGRWGVARVERAVQGAKGGRLGHVGRTPSVPSAEPELLAALDALCDKWNRWCTEASDTIPEDVKKDVGTATDAVKVVKTKVAAMLAAYAPPEG